MTQSNYCSGFVDRKSEAVSHQITFPEVTHSEQENILEYNNAPKREEMLPLKRNFAFCLVL